MTMARSMLGLGVRLTIIGTPSRARPSGGDTALRPSDSFVHRVARCGPLEVSNHYSGTNVKRFGHPFVLFYFRMSGLCRTEPQSGSDLASRHVWRHTV